MLALLAGVIWAFRLTYFRPAVVPVSAARAAIGSVEELVTNNKAGTVTARRRASLATEIGGRVVRLSVAEGDHVRKGAVLLALGDADLRAQLTLQERSQDAARSAAVEACAYADFTAAERDRSRRLLALGAIAEQAPRKPRISGPPPWPRAPRPRPGPPKPRQRSRLPERP